MKSSNSSTYFHGWVSTLVISMATMTCAQDLRAQSVSSSPWQANAEMRLKAIYDRNEFRAKRFDPKWVSDSSGFVIEEVDASSDKPTKWFYEASTGERRAATTEDPVRELNNDRRAGNGTWRIEPRREKLLAIDQSNQKEVVLAAGKPDRDIDFRNASLSPDGSKVVFVEADYTDVKQRWVLVPGDPSFPGVQQNRFARVGEAIEKLRVGLVNVDGTQLNWLPITIPEEGMYLGQVQWAGNSEEILIEKFSRFRDKRDFLLVSTDGVIK